MTNMKESIDSSMDYYDAVVRQTATHFPTVESTLSSPSAVFIQDNGRCLAPACREAKK